MFEVLTLFIIPIGGGIPAGVLLAQKKALPIPLTAALYFVSDVLLACVFEPLMLTLLHFAKRSSRFSRWAEMLKAAMNRSIMRYGVNPGPFTLVMISFGVDPMTGRVAAHAASHRFVSGWLIAIAGDMIFFTLIMASTLWLNNVLGDGTWTSIIILTLMFAGPPLIRRIRKTLARGH
jgi:hypothetical protein